VSFKVCYEANSQKTIDCFNVKVTLWQKRNSIAKQIKLHLMFFQGSPYYPPNFKPYRPIAVSCSVLGITLSPSKCTIWGPTTKSVKLATAVLLIFPQLFRFNFVVYHIHAGCFPM